MNDERALNTIRSVLNMSENETSFALSQVLRDYSMRHRNISKIFEKHFNKLLYLFDELEIKPGKVSQSQKALIGSYFTMEYSLSLIHISEPTRRTPISYA